MDHLDPSDYLRLVDKGPSSVSTKSQSPSPPTMPLSSPDHVYLVLFHSERKPPNLIVPSYARTHLALAVRNDTFRTLATDTDFKGKVREDMLIRLLEAFVWRSQGELFLLRSISHEHRSRRWCRRQRQLWMWTRARTGVRIQELIQGLRMWG